MTAAPVTLSVDGMSCAGCVGRVEKRLAGLEGVANVSVNLAAESATFLPETTARVGEAALALADLGYPARESRVTLNVADMSCAGCVGRVERALSGVAGVVAANVNHAAETAQVTYLDGVTTPDALAKSSTAAGYAAQVAVAEARPDQTERKAQDARDLARKTALAAALTLPVFVLEMGGHIFPQFHQFIAQTIGMQTSWVLQLILTSLVLFGPGRAFYAKGIPALFKGAPDMNSLVALGTGAAWTYSLIATLLPGLLPDGVRAVYFEAAAVIVVLILLGRWLEARARGRTGAAIQALLGLQVRHARIERDGAIEDVEIEVLQVGDRVIVRPGERLAVDGTILSGESYIDESMITGEPEAIRKTAGDAVIGGTVNGAGSFTFEATRVGAETTLAQIVRMVEEAQGAKLPIQSVVDRVTFWFVPAVLGLAALTVLVWLLVGPDATLALVAGVSVLIIACPCAMGLATPTSIMVGTGRAAELGVLFRRGDALQSLEAVDVVAFDKTGTVTRGKPTLTDVVVSPGLSRADVLRLAASVEARSEHPIAQALVEASPEVKAVAGFASVTGQGVLGDVEGQRVLVGTHKLLAGEGIDSAPLAAQAQELAQRGRTAVFVAIEGALAAVIGVADPVRPTSAAAIAALKAQGIAVAMISGDRRETAEAIAREVGIDRVIAEVLPEGKVAALQELRGDDGKIAFVGDGINDAPALAHADVGIAIGTGTDVAIESADVVLLSGDLRGVVNALHVSGRTMRNIRQNLVWAFGYNLALIPVAAGALYPVMGLLLSPVFAAAAMALSSVSVLTNALRLRMVRSVDLDAVPEDGFANPQPAE